MNSIIKASVSSLHTIMMYRAVDSTALYIMFIMTKHTCIS